MRTLLLLTLSVCVVGAQEVDFDQHVKPILENNCYKCHGAQRQKGDLRLDHWTDGLGKGDHPVLVPGQPDKSGLLNRVLLPADDPDFMPKSGEPLSKDELGVLKAWIAQGAKWPKTEVKDPDAEWNAQFDIGELTDGEKAAQAKAMASVKEMGGIANHIAKTTPAVDVNLSLLGAKVTDDTLGTLAGLRRSLVWLNLTRTGVTDAGLQAVGQQTRLKRLHLARTGVGDAGLAHLKGLNGLTYLNLYGTNVTDAGLAHLAGMKDLKKLYVWQTKVTPEGAAKLKAALPELIIDTGVYAKPVVVKVETKPMPVNKKCPVSGKGVSAESTSTFEDQLVAFCCNNSKGAFDKDPAKFADKVDGLKRKPVNAKCPVKGTNVNPDHVVKHDGKVVGFCCGGCKAAFTKDPAKFAAKIK